MEREECERHDVKNQQRAQYEVPTATPRVPCPTRTISLDLRSWLQHGMTLRLRSVTVVTTWRSRPSPR
jgi:hypothetical protein